MFHITFKKNGRKVKSMGDYAERAAAISDANALVAAGTIPAGVQVFVEQKKAAGRARTNPGWEKYENKALGVTGYRKGAFKIEQKPGGWSLFVNGKFEGKWKSLAKLKKACDEGTWAVGTGGSMKLNPKRTTDAAVIRAFLAGHAAASKKLTTDGRTLDGAWMGGNKIAWRDAGGVHVDDAGAKAREKVRKAVVRATPAMWIADDSHWALPKAKQRFVSDVREQVAAARQWRGPKANPRILGHDVAKSAAGYTVKPYGKKFKSKAGATKWLKGHVKRESKVNPGPADFRLVQVGSKWGVYDSYSRVVVRTGGKSAMTKLLRELQEPGKR